MNLESALKKVEESDEIIDKKDSQLDGTVSDANVSAFDQQNLAQTKISQDDATPKGSQVALENSEILQGTSSANN